MKIGSFDTSKKILLIAEIGNNHEGSYALAEEMIGAAVDAGADAVKFQTIVPNKLVTSTDIKRIQQLKKFQLSYAQFEKLAGYAREAGILFMSTPFDLESARFLDTIVPAFKIASSDNDFFPLLKTVASTGKPVLLSSGLMGYAELKQSVEYIENQWQEADIPGELAILHCVSNYPVQPGDANLSSISYLAHKFPHTIGYSDHTIGINACVLAAVLGARIIEKHFTIDKQYSDFRDHQLSADPGDLKELVERLGETLLLMGEFDKPIIQSEKPAKEALRRSIAAAVNLPVGTIINMEHLTWLRPGTGIPVGSENLVIGKKTKQAINAGEQIKPENLA